VRRHCPSIQPSDGPFVKDTGATSTCYIGTKRRQLVSRPCEPHACRQDREMATCNDRRYSSNPCASGSIVLSRITRLYGLSDAVP